MDADMKRDCRHGHQARACNVCELEAALAEITRDRDAWRAATGRADLTAGEAGDWVDAMDEERDQLRADLARANAIVVRAEGWADVFRDDSSGHDDQELADCLLLAAIDAAKGKP